MDNEILDNREKDVPPNKMDENQLETPKRLKMVEALSATANRILPSRPDTPSTQSTPERRYRNMYDKLKAEFATQSKLWQEKLNMIMEENKNNENLIQALKKQNKEMTKQREKLKIESNARITLSRREDINEDIKIKTRKNNDELHCKNGSCSNTDIAAVIRCNMCQKMICDTCSNANIAKLKSFMNNCKTLFFVCNDCSIKVTSEVSDNSEILFKNLKTILDEKTTEMEKNLEKIIEIKLRDQLSKENDSSNETDQTSYASKVLKVPDEVRKIIEETKNQERIETTEHEKREKNFIIHRSEEFGDTPEEIKGIDKNYVQEILDHLGVKSKPIYISRLGIGTSKQRPLKICMKSKIDKDRVMKNLKMLKGMENEFGNISITDDHSKEERKMLKKWIDNAKRKSEGDKEFVYKVKGDPRNGLRLFRVEKK